MQFRLKSLSPASRLNGGAEKAAMDAEPLVSQTKPGLHRSSRSTSRDFDPGNGLSAFEKNREHGAAGGNLQSLQILRGVAAVAVAFFHTNVILSMPQYGSVSAFQSLASKGWLGVNFFFILSGFIILMAHQRDVGKPSQAVKYLIRRGVRVYPIYWILTTVFMIAATLRPGYADFSIDFWNLFTTYSLIMVVDLPTLPLKVAWTLLFEVKFYLLFTLLILVGKPAILLFVAWTIAVLVANLFFTPPDWGYLLPSWGLLSIWNLNFLLGMAGFLLVTRLGERFWWFLLASGLLAMAYFAKDINGMAGYVADPPLMIAFGLAMTAIIVGCVLGERRFQWQFPRWSLYLGDASYSIYLVHSAVISLVAGLNFKFTFNLVPNEALFLLTFIVSVAVGAIVHSVLEKPLLTYSRNGIKRILLPRGA